MKITFKPLTQKTWDDFETLFGERGACGGCWCMWPRLSRKDFEKKKGAGNKRAMKILIKKKEQIGLIGYVGKEPAAWCAFAPREKYIRMEKSKVLARIDNEPVWSIPCFFVSKNFRRQGLSTEILNGVIDYCRKLNKVPAPTQTGKSRSAEKKVKILEGYPTVPYSEKIPDAFAWRGIPSAFIKAGFVEAARRSNPRPIMRYYL